MQRNNFHFEDESYETLLQRYPKCPKYVLKWWTDEYDKGLWERYPYQNGHSSQYSISRNKWLKEFMVENPPNFPVSAKCCKFSKKDLAEAVLVDNNYDLDVTGIRKSEGGTKHGIQIVFYFRYAWGNSDIPTDILVHRYRQGRI